MTAVFGTVLFLLLAHALCYALPVQAAAFTALGMVAVFDAILFFSQRPLQSAEWMPASRWAVFILFAAAVLTGMTGARFAGSDPWSWQHFPLASTIVSGNFPVMTPINPLQVLSYHYAPSFLAAMFTLLTGFPLSVGFALQPFLGACGILFFSAAIIHELLRRDRTTVIGALLALGGTGLLWLKGAEIATLASAVIHGNVTSEALRGLGNLAASPLTTAPLVFIGHRSTATGFPLFYGLAWALMHYLGGGSKWFLMAVFIFGLGLTLTMEMAFVTASMAAVLLLLVLFAIRSSRPVSMRVLAAGLFGLVPALLVAMLQGGVLSGLLSSSGEHSFLFYPQLRITYDTFGSTVVPWSIQFLRDFGLPLLFLPLTAIFAWKRRVAEPVWMFLWITAGIHLLLPFLFEYTLIKGEMRRAFYMTTSIGAMLAGVYISEAFLTSKRAAIRTGGVLLIVSMLISGVLWMTLKLLIPTGRLEPTPLFAGMPPVSADEQALYDWVKENTTQADYFYLRNLTVDFEELSDEAMQLRDRVLFTTYTGRFTIGPIIYWQYAPDWLDLVQKAETTCGADAMRALRVRYLVVTSPERLQWFRKTCTEREWIRRYGQDRLSIPAVYELTAPLE